MGCRLAGAEMTMLTDEELDRIGRGLTDDIRRAVEVRDEGLADALLKHKDTINRMRKEVRMAQLELVYFGCWREKGHFFWTRHRMSTDPERARIPWGWKIDGCLCPGYVGPYQTPSSAQVEGLARVHHKDGWTALAFWDRSVDGRGGCNSVFFIPELLDFAGAVVRARAEFPEVWARFTFPVVEAPDGR